MVKDIIVDVLLTAYALLYFITGLDEMYVVYGKLNRLRR